MEETKWREISVIFSAALAREPAQRSAYLEKACGGNVELRAELENLLAASDSRDSFIDSPRPALTADNPQPSFSAGEKIGSFEIIEALGKGGMGEVFLAKDARLDRQVALKFLSLDDEISNKRFLREARAAAALEHPHICTIHEIGEENGREFIVMQYVEGETLSALIKKGLRLQTALDIAIQTADALGEAHERGIIHRDIKPANIIVSATGQAKVLDFGLAKRVTLDSGENTSQSLLSQAGVIMGTVSYMSPEQVRGQEADARSDLWSLGVMLYEMAAGRTPFDGENTVEKLAAILYQEPEKRVEKPVEFAAILEKALRKDPKKRYQNAPEFIEALRHIKQELDFAEQLEAHSTSDSGDKRISEFLSEHPTLEVTSQVAKKSFDWKRAAAAGVIGIALLAGGWFGWKAYSVSAARESLKKVEELAKAERNFEAYDLARQVKAALPDDENLKKILPTITDSLSVNSEPSGAKVYLRRFFPDKDGKSPERIFVGETPITDLPIARGQYILQLEKEGQAPFERTISGAIPRIGGSFIATEPQHINAVLSANDSAAERMVFVPAGNYNLVNWSRPTETSVWLDAYYIDKYEVTNSEFKEFITAGGYVKPEYWQVPMEREGKPIGAGEALKEFKDKTGLPGPRSWANQNYPDGQGEHPVTDITWYEAAAYAAFRGKTLPTVFQWEKAARDGVKDPRYNAMPWGFIKQGDTTDGRANFRGTGTVAVSANEFGMSPYGAFNMAGNVSEWNLNQSPDGFVTSGGAWNDLAYSFGDFGEYPGLYSANRIGFRCALNAPEHKGDYGAQKLPAAEIPDYDPTSEADFKLWQTHYEYDKKPLDTEIIEKIETADWVREKITFTGEGGELATAYLYLPKNFNGPLQVLHYAPPGDVVLGIRSLPDSVEMFAAPFIKSGRAVFGVTLKGYRERPFAANYHPPKPQTVEFRKQMVNWITDLRLGLDYLESRDDLDKTRIGFLGVSNGANLGLVLTSLENRYKSLAFVSGGLEKIFRERSPETSPIKFASLVKTQKLFINGRYDENLPYNTDAKPLFKLLRDPKKVVIYDGGHIPTMEFMAPAVNSWFDETMGRVQ
jgi:serine/threonine protein kinase/dienelactone hydrolase